jgi:O-antigen biosynthesis protein
VRADGLLDRALVMEVPATVTFPLRLEGDVEFSGRAMLFPHDWRDLTGAVRASVAASHGDGDTTVLWADTLRAGDHGRPRGHPVGCQIPTSTVALHLSLEGPTANRGTLSRAVWVEPVLIDPHAPPRPIAPTPIETPSADGPLISVLTPVHDPPPHMLEEAIASVRNQTYANWQLCLVDDGSTNPDITTALQRHADADPRIHLTRHDTPHGISNATNAALNLATGDYIALLDHDDTLTPDALQHIAHRIATDPTLDMLYSDEDIVLDGQRVWAHLKPAWSPDTLRTNGYTCHLGVYRRALVREIGGFRTEFNGSQDVDMILRLTERTDRIAHVPRILYHWRAHRDSTAGGDAKPYAYVAARNAIVAHLGRIGLAGDVGFGPPGLYRLAHRVEPALTVDLVLAVEDADGLADAAATWLAQPHPSWNVVLAAPDAILDDAVAALTGAGIPETRITAVAGTGLSSAATAATAEHLLLMQTPGAGLTHDWLTRLLGYSAQAGIAAAGPVLLAPDGRIAQAGIAIPEGIPLHVLHGARSSMDVLFGYGTSVYNVSAVSGILATPRATYEQLGGLDPTYGELGLIHYCLRAADDHLRTVIVPDARLRTTGPDPTTNDLPTLWRLRNTWARTHTHDPYYNPSYRTDRGDFVLRRYD